MRRRTGRGIASVGLVLVMLTACAGVPTSTDPLPVAASAPARTTWPVVPPIRVFDAEQVEKGVRVLLTDPAPDGYGLAGVRDIRCPADERVIAGGTFTCALILQGRARTVHVTVLDDEGRYEIGPPL